MDYSPPGSPVHGILHTRILEWVTFSSPEDLHEAGIEPGSPALQADSIPCEPAGKPSELYLTSNEKESLVLHRNHGMWSWRNCQGPALLHGNIQAKSWEGSLHPGVQMIGLLRQAIKRKQTLGMTAVSQEKEQIIMAVSTSGKAQKLKGHLGMKMGALWARGDIA